MYNKQKFVNLRSIFLFLLGVLGVFGVSGYANMLMRDRERDNVFYNASYIDKAP